MMMRFNKPKCPECGQLAAGILETVSGLALLRFTNARSGRAMYDGEMDVDWDSQNTCLAPDGRVFLECQNGHLWLSKKEKESRGKGK